MEIQNKQSHSFYKPENYKPYVVVGLGVLVLLVSIYQVAFGAPSSLLSPRGDKESLQEAVNPGSTQSSKEEDIVVENIDSDSDGLTDAEEERIYQTSPLKPDTDNDGFKDGDEVAAGYDPRVNEAGGTTTTADSTTTDDSSYYDYNRFIAKNPDDLSKIDPTQYLSDEDIQKIQNGEAPSDINKLSSLVLANTAISEDEVLPKIPDSEITIVESQGKAAVQQYLFAVAGVMLKYSPAAGQREVIDYVTAALGGDNAKVRESVRLAGIGVTELKKIPVPREMIDIHKRAIGILQVFIDSSQVLLNAGNVDPTDGLTATNKLRVISRAMDDLMADVFSITEKYGIQFTL